MSLQHENKHLQRTSTVFRVSTRAIHGTAATLGEKFRKVDWVGGLSLICSATLFLIAVSWGGVQYDWYSVATLVPLALGTIGLVWTVMYETYLVKTSFLRSGLVWSTSSAAICVCGAVQGLVVGC